ncbi:MAG: hypothetical protein ABI639_02040 [Thermoanaerobaculia bacterium]
MGAGSGPTVALAAIPAIAASASRRLAGIARITTITTVLALAGGFSIPAPVRAAGAPKAKSARPPVDPCEATCATFHRAELEERQLAVRSSCPNYVSVLADPLVARVRLAPELAGREGSAIDDELWLTINGVDVWHRKFRNKDSSETLWKKKDLQPGCNEFALHYSNTREAEAYFMVDLGGQAFCGGDAPCRRIYREGLDFGTGLIFREPVLTAALWNSRLSNPNAAGCFCSEPGSAEIYEALAPLIGSSPALPKP